MMYGLHRYPQYDWGKIESIFARINEKSGSERIQVSCGNTKHSIKQGITYCTITVILQLKPKKVIDRVITVYDENDSPMFVKQKIFREAKEGLMKFLSINDYGLLSVEIESTGYGGLLENTSN